jgi:hypothetical protein
MAKIWRVYLQDTKSRYYWFETKKEAEVFAQKCRLKNDMENPKDAIVKVSAEEFDTSRKGLTEAMNYVISITCFNEG